MELLPLCNMNCKMCYVRKSKTEMDAEGRMLSCDEWLSIADEAVEAGTLFCCLLAENLYCIRSLDGYILHWHKRD